MILFDCKVYATVWSVKPSENGKYIDLQVTTGDKRTDGTWSNSGWFPRVIGHALNSIKNVKKGDRILITKGKLSNERFQREDGTYGNSFKFIILEAEPVKVTNSAKQEPEKQEAYADYAVPYDDKESEDEDNPW